MKSQNNKNSNKWSISRTAIDLNCASKSSFSKKKILVVVTFIETVATFLQKLNNPLINLSSPAKSNTAFKPLLLKLKWA